MAKFIGQMERFQVMNGSQAAACNRLALNGKMKRRKPSKTTGSRRCFIYSHSMVAGGFVVTS